MPKKYISKEEKVKIILRKMKLKGGASLSDVLLFMKKKFKLKTLTPHITTTVGMWRFNNDNLWLQRKYCIDWIYYLVMVKKPKYDKRNTNQKDGVE